MSELIRVQLASEARASLEHFRQTGWHGYWQKAVDRLRVLGIDPSRCPETQEGAGRLIEHLALFGLG